MAAPDYRVVLVDLTVGRASPVSIIDQGVKINGVTVQFVPAGAALNLHFGANREGVPIVTGDSWDVAADGPNGCPVPLDEGLFVSNPAGAGTAQLIVSFGNIGAGAQTRG